ncbi:MAG: hypothetical protein ACJ763_01975 [Bdellovibrionia bacterium]
MKGSKLIRLVVLTAIAGVSIQSPAFAGKEAGNGGGGVVCFNSNDVASHVRKSLLKNLKYPALAQDPLADVAINTITDVTPLDLYEKSVSFNTAQSTLGDIVREKTDQFAETGVWVAGYVKGILDQNPLPGKNWSIKPMSPLAIDDTMNAITFPPRCVLMQIARQDHLAGEIQFRIDERLFQKMSVKEQAALVLHELVYAVLADTNSLNTREVVRLIAQLGGANDESVRSRLKEISSSLDARPDVDRVSSGSELSYAKKMKIRIYDAFVTVADEEFKDLKGFDQDPTELKEYGFNIRLFEERFSLNGNEFRIITPDPRCSDPLFGLAEIQTESANRADGKLVRGLSLMSSSTVQKKGSGWMDLIDTNYCDGKSILSFTDKNGQNFRFKIGKGYNGRVSEIKFDPATARPLQGVLSQAASVGHGIVLQKDQLLELTPDGMIKKAYLDPSTDPKVYANLPICFECYVEFNSKGGISGLSVAKEYKLNDFVIQPKSWITLSEKGVILSAASASGVYNGIEFAKSSVSFYESGAVKGFERASGVYNGIVLAQNSNISFYENGQIMGIAPYQSESFQGVRNVPGTRVTFHANGKVEYIQPDQDVTIGGWTFAAKSWVHFYESGQVQEGTLNSEPRSYQGILIKPGSGIAFFPNGSINILVANGGVYRGIQIKADTPVNFYQEGYPISLTAVGGSYQGFQLAQSVEQVEGWGGWKSNWDTTVGGFGGNVTFYSNGRLRAALLAAGNKVGGLKTRSTPAYFYSNGQVYGASYMPGQVLSFGPYQVVTSISTGGQLESKLVAFYPNGTPIYGWLAQPASFGGFQWKNDFYLYSNGSLLWSTLAKTQVVNGHVYYEGNSFSLTPKGEFGNFERSVNPWKAETEAFVKKLEDEDQLKSKPPYEPIFSFEYRLF